MVGEGRTRGGRRLPRRLLVGDRVALVAPASPVRGEDLERGADELRALGFVPVYDQRVLARHGYVAGLPQTRVAALAEAWRDPSIRAVIAVRGGYGSQQLLPLLDPRWIADDPKIFLGYSDLTAVLAWHTMHGVVAFHGPMAEGRLALGSAGYDRASLLAAVAQPVHQARVELAADVDQADRVVPNFDVHQLARPQFIGPRHRDPFSFVSHDILEHPTTRRPPAEHRKGRP